MYTKYWLTACYLLRFSESRSRSGSFPSIRLQHLTGFIRVREMSGNFKFFQGQGIVREFYVVSVKNRYLLKCQGFVREFYNFHFVSTDEKKIIAKAVYLTFWIQAKSF